MLIFKTICTEDIRRCEKRFYWTAGIMIVLGLVSLSMLLLIFSFAIEVLVGGLMSAVGASEAVTAYRSFRDGDKPWQTVFMAVISLLAGIIFSHSRLLDL